MILLEMNPLSGTVAISEMVIILAISAFVGWWIGRRRIMGRLQRLEVEVASLETELQVCKEKVVLSKVRLSENEPVETPDNLKLIEGIGPMIEALLTSKGIRTYSSLASVPSSALKAMLDEAGHQYQLHDPTSWPQQAALARDGRWDDLGALQDRLNGGKLA
ncbi:hypothetical protein CLV98_101239 [Dyadobacter jejuensis]|uniref:Uncharacterized protein n=1 Tax=Dyadobacter jejuensis TaxID=1082580 RepID=A0A316AQR5_9BACT|nr:hypothetical protein [Dyadobacter jejuensis]PWJ60063.1 hypothetical protein CLV98_101239 [Dyadobacter jejuensis]